MSANVTNTSADYDYWHSIWQKCRDFAQGQDKVMEKDENSNGTYLPVLEGQKDLAYEKYLKSGYLYNATGRTRQGFLGMIMRKDPDIDVPDALEAIMEDIDQEGTDAMQFAEELAKEELTVARGGILIDYPDQNTGDMSQAEAEALNLRPYAVMYKAENILAIRKKRINNASMPIQIRLYEIEETEGDKEFETEVIERVRVLELVDQGGSYIYQQRLFTKGKADADNEWVEMEPYIPRMSGQPLNEIPFVFIGDEQYREPHILDLVNANLQHYIQTADHRAGLKWTTRPQPWGAGVSQEEADSLDSLGTGEFWAFKDPGAQIGLLEYTGTGLSAVENTLNDLKDEMATLGARMVSPDKRSVESAEAHTIKRQGENSALANVSKHVATALTKTLQWCARWVGADETAISVKLNTDFIPVSMSAKEMKDLFAVYQGGGMTQDDFLWNLEQGERHDPAINREDRKSQLQTTAPNELL